MGHAMRDVPVLAVVDDADASVTTAAVQSWAGALSTAPHVLAFDAGASGVPYRDARHAAQTAVRALEKAPIVVGTGRAAFLAMDIAAHVPAALLVLLCPVPMGKARLLADSRVRGLGWSAHLPVDVLRDWRALNTAPTVVWTGRESTPDDAAAAARLARKLGEHVLCTHRHAPRLTRPEDRAAAWTAAVHDLRAMVATRDAVIAADGAA